MSRLNCTTAVVGRWFLLVISTLALGRNLPAQTRVYTGLVVTDVRVGTILMHNASLKITFEGDTDNIVPVAAPTVCTGPAFFYLAKGVARMEIEFQGRTRTARLDDDQVFVAVDECNGGIGFGSFTGPNGMEPAYPLAFTLGTAEYAAINYGDPYGAPLKVTLSTTGSAWSCIGYPPVYVDQQQQGTLTGDCIPPDNYPLKSDIGDVFIYQPYYEHTDPGGADIQTNHAGSTNRGAFIVRPKADGPGAARDASESAHRSGVIYTLQTVADGTLGRHAFHQALVTFQMVSDIHSVTSQPSSVDVTKRVYENRAGYATITVDDGGDVITAEFDPGEVYVRYDTGAGVAGFGSKISPTYPIALDCSDSAYPSESDYTVDCLRGEVWNYLNSPNSDGSSAIFRAGTLAQLNYPVAPSAGIAQLRPSLSRNTLLTGTAHTCAGVYKIDPGIQGTYFPGDLGLCGGPAPRGLHTSKGELYLQDLEGGTLTLSNQPPIDEAGTGGGWDLANSGFLHVEVYEAER
jgi:hypothetical protein